MLRQVSLIVAVPLLLGGGVVWIFLLEPIRVHAEFYSDVRGQLQSLAKKRPPNVTPKQWENIVGWTLNAHANCFAHWHQLSQQDMKQFEVELRQHLAGPVTLETIDWIWDEIVRLSPLGQSYSDNYRPTRPSRLQEFEESNVSWGIQVE